MKYLSLILFFSGIAFHQQASAQITDHRFEVEADPIAFLLSGYSFHLGYMTGNLRFDAGAYGIKQPAFSVGNDKFSVYSSGVGLKGDYFLKQNKGLFIGLQSDYVTDKIELKSTGGTRKTDYITAGLRGGYRFAFGDMEKHDKGFYLVPWIAVIYAANTSKTIVDNEIYESGKWSLFPTLHIGYRF